MGDPVAHVNQLEKAAVIFSGLPVRHHVLVQRQVTCWLTVGAVK
jgi:hypothetical protein